MSQSLRAYLDEVRARCERATPGPWSIDILSQDEEGSDGIAQVPEALVRATSDGDYLNIANAEFIAYAREDISRLLTIIDGARICPPAPDCV